MQKNNKTSLSLRTVSYLAVLLALTGLATMATTATAAERVTLLGPADGDLVSAALAAPTLLQKAAVAANVSREAVAMSWAMRGDVESAPAPFVAESREYFLEVSAAELAAGVVVFTDSPRALVRVNPVGAASADLAERVAIDPSRFELVAPDGRAFSGGAGMELLADAAQLQKAGAPFAPGTSAFRLDAELGAGAFELRAVELEGEGRYQVHVFQPESRLGLVLRTDRQTYFHGDTLVIETALVEDGGESAERSASAERKTLALREVDGYVVSPAGKASPVTFRRTRSGDYRARLTVDADERPLPGLWQVQVAANGARGGETVMRSAKVAFAAAVATARLDGTAVLGAEEGLAVRLGVETAAEGRYEVRGVLYGHVDGALQAVAVGHSANWLEIGGGALELRFDGPLLEGVEGPFEVRDLRLLDQGRMGLLHRQAKGLLID